MSRSYSAALPIAYVVLRVLVVLNWLSGAAILALLTATILAKEWTLTALGIPPSSTLYAMIVPLRAIAVIGLIGIPLNHLILTRLLAMVATVRQGDPFVADNAERLRAIAWILLALQLLSLLVAAIAEAVSTPEHPLDLDAGFSTTGWLAVLLTFVLARVFAEGALMRDELEGTV